MRDVVGFEGYYKVNCIGLIWSTRSKRFLKSSLKPNGYRYIEFNVLGKVSYHRVHRLVAEAFIPNPKDKPFVNHKNGNKSDNYYRNLEWVTGSENNLHAIDSGLAKIYYNIYEVECPDGDKYICKGYEDIMSLTGASKNAVWNWVKGKYNPRSGHKIKFIERATTIPKGSTLKRVEMGRDSLVTNLCLSCNKSYCDC